MKVKEIVGKTKTKAGTFIKDTCEYFEKHPMVFGTIVQGGFVLLIGGVLYGATSAQKEVAEAYKTGVFKSLANGKKFKKEMTFAEGMKYLEFYNKKENNWKKCQNYLKERGYID